MKARLVVLGVALWLSNFALPSWYERTFQPAQEARRRLDVLLDVLGESRTVLARYLWFKADLYHEILQQQGVETFTERDAVPLLRVVTYLDPHLEDAFDVLAWDLIRGYKKPEQSLSFLEEGIAYNPKSYLLNFRKAMILHRLKRYPEAVDPGEKALFVAREDVDQLNALRILYVCYEHEARWEDCLRVLDLWLKIRPDDSRPLTERVKTLKKLGRTS